MNKKDLFIVMISAVVGAFTSAMLYILLLTPAYQHSPSFYISVGLGGAVAVSLVMGYLRKNKRI